MKKPKISLVAIYGLCTVIYTTQFVRGIDTDMALLNFLCAVLFAVCFVLALKNYLSGKTDD